MDHLQLAFLKYRESAEERGISWALTIKTFSLLIGRNCYYCGTPPDQKMGLGKRNGVDRVENTIGYIYSNCVPCCWACNKLKGNLSLGEWGRRLDSMQAALRRWIKLHPRTAEAFTKGKRP